MHSIFICESCKKEFVPKDTKHARFCSRSCSNKGRDRASSWTLEKREQAKRKSNSFYEKVKENPEQYLTWKKKLLDSTKESRDKRKKESFEAMMLSDFSSLSWDLKRKRILEEQDNSCGRCKTKEWFSRSLPIEIEHIDGNNQNDARENLIGLCPNCHSITDTWRGRNKRTCKKVSDEDAIKALKSSTSIRQALVKVGMSPKGGNYVRFSKLSEQIEGLVLSS